LLPAGPLVVTPLARAPRYTWRLPGSKSITNRALVLAALADGQSRLEGVLESDDTRHMAAALIELGITIRRQDPDTLLVDGGRARLRQPSRPLEVGNSGTTVRFLTALACLVPGEVELVGDAHMAKRPIAELVEGLRQLGASIDCPTGCPPLRVRGGRLAGGVTAMRGDRSSQYFSALLMVASLAEGPIQLRVEGGRLVSRPYVDMTCRMVADFGGEIRAEAQAFTVAPRPAYRPRAYAVEPDASAASYPFALAAATGGAITVPGLGRQTLQGDYAFAELLASAGARVTRAAGGTTVDGQARRLRGLDVDMHDISDTVMTLAALAPLLDGPTTIRNVANIRIKETDRLAATVAELRRLGQEVSHGEDWLRIEPRPIVPAVVRCYGDHRMAMSFAVLGLATAGVTIEDPACVAKTYPGFWDDVEACRGSATTAD
jgi:3-phosphoshikimate 1-carboxyvinyltransferase